MTESMGTITPGCPNWADLSTSDQAASLAFYCALFGWDAETPNEQLGYYANFLREGQRIAGSMRAMNGAPDAWTVHFASDDVEKTAELVVAHGGQIHAPAMDVMDLGRLAIAADPGGTAFGIWQPGTHTGFAVLDEPGAPSWFELNTRDYDAALRFYSAVLGWTTTAVADAPEFRYSTATVDGTEVCGVMDGRSMLPEGAPSMWQVYFNVTDVEARVAAAVALGATLVNGVDDSPYGLLAELTDVTGATFKLRQP